LKPTTPTKGELFDALKVLCDKLGEMPHDWPSQELFRAYCRATDLLDPDEFGERFRAQARVHDPREVNPKGVVQGEK
jgi:hypothetical protein